MPEINDAERDFLRETAVRVSAYLPDEEVRADVLRAAEVVGKDDPRGAESIKTLVDDGINLNRATIADVIRRNSFHLTPESLSKLVTDVRELVELYYGLPTGLMNADMQSDMEHSRRQLASIEERLIQRSIPEAKGIFDKEGVDLKAAHVVNLRVLRSTVQQPVYADASGDRKALEAELAGVRIRLDDFHKDWESRWKKFQ